MRKLMVLSLIMVFVLAIHITGAQGDIITFGNNTWVEAWYYSNPYHGSVLSGSTFKSYDANNDQWYDRIGAYSEFETFGGTFDTNTNVLTIHTNWGPANRVGTLNSRTADLFLWTGGSFFAIGVRTGSDVDDRQGKVWVNPSYFTSYDKFFNSGGIYGGRYDFVKQLPVPVEAKGDATSGYHVDVSYNAVSNKPWSYEIVFELGDLGSAFNPNAFKALWGTGTCANDTFEAVVPLPGALLLLGAGLVRLAAYARRRQD